MAERKDLRLGTRSGSPLVDKSWWGGREKELPTPLGRGTRLSASQGVRNTLEAFSIALKVGQFVQGDDDDEQHWIECLPITR